MSSRLLLNLGLLITVIVLGLYVYLSPAPSPPPGKPTLTQLKASAIDHITIHSIKKPDTVVEKQNGHWRLIQPVNMPANEYQVNKVARLAQTASESQFPKQQDKLAEMGLQQPKLTVTLNDVSLSFGATNPINQYRYVLLGDKVHLILDTVSHILYQAPASLGDPALLPGHDNITRLKLPGFTLSKDKDDNWKVDSADASTSSLSQDDLIAFIDDWRFAEALHISFFDKLTEQDKTLPKIVMTLKGHDKPLTFYLDDKGKDFTLIGTDPNIRYHLLKEKQKTLLTLPKPDLPAKADSTGTPDDD